MYKPVKDIFHLEGFGELADKTNAFIKWNCFYFFILLIQYNNYQVIKTNYLIYSYLNLPTHIYRIL